MAEDAIIFAILFLALVFCTVGYVSASRGAVSLPEFFFARRSVRTPLVVNLLISGSFSLNGMLYQVYLGYKIGWWALITQIAWSLSYALLGIFSSKVSTSNGLHSFLGSAFSTQTRVLAGILSVIGLGLQIGWEYNVTKSALSGLTTPALSTNALELMALSIFAIGTFYTMSGGLRSNLLPDFIQNFLKSACFIVALIFIIAIAPLSHDWLSLKPFSSVIAELGVMGLLANIGFSLAWQFVDLATWQAAIATRPGSTNTKSALRSAGWLVFIAPGILGTAIGIGLNGTPNLTSDTVFPTLISTIGIHPWMIFILTVAIGTSAMSFVDTMMLGVGFTAVSDLLFRKWVDQYDLLSSNDLSKDTRVKRVTATIIGWSRFTILSVAVIGTVIVGWISERIGVSLFDLVYVVVVSQLSMFGPVLVALMGRLPQRNAGIAAISISLVVGYVCSIYGTVYNDQNILNGASIVTIVVSFSVAWFSSKSVEKTAILNSV